MLLEQSPDLHAAVDDDADTGDVRALVRGRQKPEIRHLLRPAEATANVLPSMWLAPSGSSSCARVELLSIRRREVELAADPMFSPGTGERRLPSTGVRAWC